MSAYRHITPKSPEAIAALAALRNHEGVQPSPPPHPAYGRIPGYPYAAEEAVWKVWEAKREELDREWQRVWAIECAAAAAKEAAILAEEKPVLSLRISDRSSAEALICQICTYDTTEGREYGRILRATASEIVLYRLSMTAMGGFVPHSVPVCPRSRNRVSYSRDIRLVKGAAEAAAKEVAERKRVADEEAAILAEAKRRLAEEAKEQQIQAAMAAMRPSAFPYAKGTIVD
jgi:hypothetical protein